MHVPEKRLAFWLTFWNEHYWAYLSSKLLPDGWNEYFKQHCWVLRKTFLSMKFIKKSCIPNNIAIRLKLLEPGPWFLNILILLNLYGTPCLMMDRTGCGCLSFKFPARKDATPNLLHEMKICQSFGYYYSLCNRYG